MYITRALIGRKPRMDQAIQTRKSNCFRGNFFKNLAGCCDFIKLLELRKA